MDKSLKQITEIIISEGNRKAFEYKGFNCLIRRVENTGHLCGYVEIPLGHKYNGKDYEEVEEDTDYEIPAHGGLTYASSIDGEGFWLGFDCAHAGDRMPTTELKMMQHSLEAAEIYADSAKYETYRTMAYVEQILKDMVDFLVKQEK